MTSGLSISRSLSRLSTTLTAMEDRATRDLGGLRKRIVNKQNYLRQLIIPQIDDFRGIEAVSELYGIADSEISDAQGDLEAKQRAVHDIDATLGDLDRRLDTIKNGPDFETAELRTYQTLLSTCSRLGEEFARTKGEVASRHKSYKSIEAFSETAVLTRKPGIFDFLFRRRDETRAFKIEIDSVKDEWKLWVASAEKDRDFAEAALTEARKSASEYLGLNGEAVRKADGEMKATGSIIALTRSNLKAASVELVTAKSKLDRLVEARNSRVATWVIERATSDLRFLQSLAVKMPETSARAIARFLDENADLPEMVAAHDKASAFKDRIGQSALLCRLALRSVRSNNWDETSRDFPELGQSDVVKIHSTEDCDDVLKRIRDIADANYIATVMPHPQSRGTFGGTMRNVYNRNG